MLDPAAISDEMLAILDRTGAQYHAYRHRPVLSYEDAEAVGREQGWSGTEGKVVVCRADDGYAVYVTRQGERLDQRAMKRALGVRKLRVASADELRAGFAAEPGAAYPFGFAAEVPILVDPAIYDEDWLLFSAALPTVTLRIRGRDLRRLFAGLANHVSELPSAASGEQG
ncbi:MAG TPA: YbaK/EbsC family protein [Nitrolancea sp.]|nr:YbaK/EbsC family protein [Nitrolancea sp.]